MINENKTQKNSSFGLEMEELLDIILERFRNWFPRRSGSQVWCPDGHADTQLDHGQLRDGL